MMVHEFKFSLSYRPIIGKRKNEQKKNNFLLVAFSVFFLIDRTMFYRHVMLLAKIRGLRIWPAEHWFAFEKYPLIET